MDIEKTEKIVGLIERLTKAYDIALTPRPGKQMGSYDMNALEKAIDRLSDHVCPEVK